MTLPTLIANNPIARRLLLQSARKRAAAFKSCDPLVAQHSIFAKLINTAAETQFGHDYGFARIAGMPFHAAYHHFRETVPIRSYQQFWNDYFAQCQTPNDDGTQAIRLNNLTWPGKINFFCETSGTTAPSKFIPFSDQMFAENRRAALDLISCYLDDNPASFIASGKILYMSGSTTLNRMAPGIYSGDMSAITLRFRPWYLAPFVEPSPEVSALPWEEKLQAMAVLLLNDRRIRVISGVPPWILLVLKRCRELSGGRALPELMPHLELIIHGGTSITPYMAEFHELFGSAMPRLIELLPSSEAFMGFQCARDRSMRLTPFYGTFFEFVRFEDLGDDGKSVPHGPAVSLDQVVTGQRYAVILSTCSGLWRYHIGDTIRFTGLNPYFIEFAGRDRVLDKLEEKVTQEEIELAVTELNRCGSGVVREFMVGAEVHNRRHVWVLAARNISRGTDWLADQLDCSLRRQNADYDTFRTQGRIATPRIILSGEDMIYEWSKTIRGKLGGQSKIPRIDASSDCSMIASLEDFIVRQGV